MEKTNAEQAMRELTMMLIYLSRFADGEKFEDAKDFYSWEGYNFRVLNKLERVHINLLQYRKKCDIIKT